MEEQTLEQHGLEESEQGTEHNNMQPAALIFPYPPPGYFATRSKHVVLRLPPNARFSAKRWVCMDAGGMVFLEAPMEKAKKGKKKQPHSNTQTRKRGTSNGQ